MCLGSFPSWMPVTWQKNSLMFSRESKYDPKHENTSEILGNSTLLGCVKTQRPASYRSDLFISARASGCNQGI